MDGIHDLGGKQGYGRINKRPVEPVFSERWEAAVFAMQRAVRKSGATVTGDRFRHAVERIEPAAYLTHGYYGRWLGALETLLVEAGIFTQADITERAVDMGGDAAALVAARPAPKPDPAGLPAQSVHSARSITARTALFTEGDSVQTTSVGVNGHTRLPAYARGRKGIVVACHDGWVFPDTNAHGQGENPQFLYTVAFSSEELWGRDGFSVRLDLFEPYLQKVDAND